MRCVYICIYLDRGNAGKQLPKVVQSVYTRQHWGLSFTVASLARECKSPHYGFTWHFPDDQENQAPSHTLIDHLDVLFHEVHVQVLASFSIRLSFEFFFLN